MIDLVDDDDLTPPMLKAPPPPVEVTPKVLRKSAHRAKDALIESGRVPPHSVEAEEFLISCCLIDGESVINRCIEERIGSKSFFVPANRVIFSRLLVMHAKQLPIDLAILVEELKTSREMEEAGGMGYLTRISGRLATTAQTGYFIEKVRECQLLRDFITQLTSGVEECYQYSGGGVHELFHKYETGLGDFCHKAKNEEEIPERGIFDFTYPEGDDPNSLLGLDDWAGRGGGLLFVSHAGAGKSSLILDACMEWTQGKPFVGIASKGKHKILVVQSEDSERYLGKIATSFRAAGKLTDADCKEISDRMVVATVKGKCGMEFLVTLERLCRKHQPDIVVINPVYLYIEGDVSDSKETKAFLNGLDLINAKNGNQFCWVLVHHTGKPPREEQRETMDWETAYAGIGSSVWANWPRCSMLLEPRPKDAGEGRFWLRLGKAGKNAGVVREYDFNGERYRESVTKIGIRHSAQCLDIAGQAKPMIYWEEDMECQGEEEQARYKKAEGDAKKGGRAGSYSPNDLIIFYPANAHEYEGLSVIARRAREGCLINEKTFTRYHRDMIETGWVESSGSGWRRTKFGDEHART